MTLIDPSSQFGAFLRSRISELKRPEPADALAQGKTPGLQRDPPRAGAANSFMDSLSLLEPTIRQQLLQRVRALGRDDARQPRKVFQLFMESILMQEFSGNAKADVDWELLARPVIDQMESDPELSSAIREAAHYLVDAAAAPQA
jgi:hypothetical protein